MPHTVQLAATVWEVTEGQPVCLLGGTTMRLFSKKGRLKTGKQRLRLWLGRQADFQWPGTTPGKCPKADRGETG